MAALVMLAALTPPVLPLVKVTMLLVVVAMLTAITFVMTTK